MGSTELHPRVLRELAGITARLHFYLRKVTETGRGPQRLEKHNCGAHLEKKSPKGNCWLISLTAVHVEIHVLLEHISGHRKEEVIRNSQHAFTKGESCLTNVIAFCNKMTGFV